MGASTVYPPFFSLLGSHSKRCGGGDDNLIKKFNRG